MKWTFVIQQKLKIAVLLGVIMAAVVLFNLALQKNISDINQSVNSMYNDRLIPATDIFYLSESLHSRQLALEKFLYRNDRNASELRVDLKAHNTKIFKLISKYEKTYLVDEETVFLSNLKSNINRYSIIENRILASVADGRNGTALRLYENEGRVVMERTVSQLSDLATIQSAVGGKLVKDTKGMVALSGILSDLQIAIAIIIGLMITALIVSSRIINQPQSNFNWN